MNKPTNSSKWKRHRVFASSLRSSTNDTPASPAKRDSKWVRRSKPRVDSTERRKDGRRKRRRRREKREKEEKKDVPFCNLTAEMLCIKTDIKDERAAGEATVKGDRVVDGGRKGKALRADPGGSGDGLGGSGGGSGDSSSGPSDGSGSSGDGSGSSGDGSGGDSTGTGSGSTESSGDGSSGDSSSGSGSSGSDSSSGYDPSTMTWDDWVDYVLTTDDPASEALFKSALQNADYSRLTRKIGAIACPYRPNLCYINAGTQALAATGFVHYITRPDQLHPIIGAHDITPITKRFASAFKNINQWYSAGFDGNLASRIGTGRVDITPDPVDIALGMPPFYIPETGFTPMCDITEFLDNIVASFDNEYANEMINFMGTGAGAEGFVPYTNPIMGSQTTKIACLICGYTYVEQDLRPWVGALQKPQRDWNYDGRFHVSLEDTLNHFTRVTVVENEHCISCNLIDVYKILKKAHEAQEKDVKAAATPEEAAAAGPDIPEIDRRLKAVENTLRRKLTNHRIYVDDMGRVAGIPMRAEAVTPLSRLSKTQAISDLPNTVILGYNLVKGLTSVKNRTLLTIPPTITFAPWTADMRDGGHSLDPLLPLRPPSSKFNDGIEYQCRAISYHNGTTVNSGHFYTDRLPWIPSNDDLASGKDSKQPYEWWLCNESYTDMFVADQPFPRPCGAKEQEVLVVYERIMDPADKAAMPPIPKTHTLNYDREYHFSEFGVPGTDGAVVFKNKEGEAWSSVSTKISAIDLTGITGTLSAVGMRSSKRVRVYDDEDGRLVIHPLLKMDKRPSKRMKVVDPSSMTGLRSAKPNKEIIKAMGNLHNPALIVHPKVLADKEQKKKWRMGGSYGGNFIIPPGASADDDVEDQAGNIHEQGELEDGQDTELELRRLRERASAPRPETWPGARK
ncbi:hypothetical protein TWF481_001006 [Arthrobotrys musiformis]|uniref:ubiquitinyl hydrolase 1 n=1 Tax=Arthrobotrys musiformis TaxID=47236 RepID=A0AAV9WPI4_9PEZI